MKCHLALVCALALLGTESALSSGQDGQQAKSPAPRVLRRAADVREASPITLPISTPHLRTGMGTLSPGPAGSRLAFPSPSVYLLNRSFSGPSVSPVQSSASSPDRLDDLIGSMSIREKAGQLFLLGFDGPHASGATVAISELRAGGITLLANATTAGQARALTGELQQLAGESAVLPLMIALDHEGGSVQRIRAGVTNFPSNWQIGKVQPAEIALARACSRGAIHGRELASLGIQMNLAPVLDVWDNPQNSVIGDRSYSDDPDMVARLGAAYIEAMQAEGVLAVGKHFPGHGSSTEDSHLTLPVVSHDRAWLEAHELVPFRAAAQANVAAIMTAYVSYPLLDPVPDRPGSLSPAIVSGLLRGDLGYDGLVVTDDMGAMEAITARYEAGEAAVRALQAGADMLIVVGPVAHQRRMVEALMAEVGNRISPEQLDASVRRVLRAKQEAGLLGPDRPGLAPASPLCAAA